MFKSVERAFPEEMRPAVEAVKDAVYTHIGDPYFVEMDADGDNYEIHVIHSVPEKENEYELILYDSRDGLIRYERRVDGEYYYEAVTEEEQILRHVDPTGR